MSTRAPGTRLRLAHFLLISFLAGLFLCSWSRVGEAQSLPYVVRVEEDWELVAGEPDTNNNAPQLSCVTSPVGHVQSLHAALVLNHQSLPDFVPGGIQLQVWNGETPLLARKYPNPALMANPGETVRWTQSVCLEEGLLTFEVVGGSSTTWGAFGGQGYLKASVPATLSDLNGYDPEVSVKSSGVSYAANRVESLVLRKVRLVMSNGGVIEDDTPRPVGQ